MPYYAWRGVKIDASFCAGTRFARDEKLLERMLFRQGIALINCSEKKYIPWPISAEQKRLFFEHFYALLHAGVHVWQSLAILGQQISDPQLATIVDQIGLDVEQGKSLHDAFFRFRHVFTLQMIHVVDLGAQSDNLSIALCMLCEHLKMMQEFKRKVGAALFLPLITLGMFFILFLIILFFIIPQYAVLFSSMSAEVPGITKMLLSLSSFITSYYMLGVSFIVITIFTVFYKLSKQPNVKRRIDGYRIHIPFFGLGYTNILLVQFLRSLALLLHGGMSLVPALKIAKQAVNNDVVQDQIQRVIEEVETGNELSSALQNNAEICGQDIVLLLTVAEETGSLAIMVERAADMYQQKVERTLHRYATILQPVLMVILGLMIAGLIFAVYMPLFNLADVI